MNERLKDVEAFKNLLSKTALSRSFFKRKSLLSLFAYHLKNFEKFNKEEKTEIIMIIFNYYNELIKDISIDDIFIFLNNLITTENGIETKRYNSLSNYEADRNIISIKTLINLEVPKEKELDYRKKVLELYTKNKEGALFSFILSNPTWLSALEKTLKPKHFYDHAVKRVLRLPKDEDFKKWFFKNLKRSRKGYKNVRLHLLNELLAECPSLLNKEEKIPYIENIFKNNKNNKYSYFEKITILSKCSFYFKKHWCEAFDCLKDLSFDFNMEVSSYLIDHNDKMPKEIEEKFKEVGLTIRKESFETFNKRSNLIKLVNAEGERDFKQKLEIAMNENASINSLLKSKITKDFEMDLILDNNFGVKLKYGNVIYEKSVNPLIIDMILFSNEDLVLEESGKELLQLNHKL